jgi:hypothetical protein
MTFGELLARKPSSGAGGYQYPGISLYGESLQEMDHVKHANTSRGAASETLLTSSSIDIIYVWREYFPINAKPPPNLSIIVFFQVQRCHI